MAAKTSRAHSSTTPMMKTSNISECASFAKAEAHTTLKKVNASSVTTRNGQSKKLLELSHQVEFLAKRRFISSTISSILLDLETKLKLPVSLSTNSTMEQISSMASQSSTQSSRPTTSKDSATNKSSSSPTKTNKQFTSSPRNQASPSRFSSPWLQVFTDICSSRRP